MVSNWLIFLILVFVIISNLFFFKNLQTVVMLLPVLLSLFKNSITSYYNFIIINITDTNYNFIYILLFFVTLLKFFKNQFNIIIILLIYCLYQKNIFSNEHNLVDVVLFFKKNMETLSNGLFFVHPTILYVGFAAYAFKINFKINLTALFIFFSTSIFLGGWWAAQELNWGGWWSWDFVEFLALLLQLKILIQLHAKLRHQGVINSVFSRIINFFFLILILHSSKLGLVSSVHAFTSFNALENFFLSVIGAMFVRKLINLRDFSSLNRGSDFFFWFGWFFFLLVYFLSFFFFKSFSNYVSIENFKNVSYFFSTYFLFFFKKIFFVANIFFFSFYQLLVCIIIFKFKKKKIHAFIFLFLFFNAKFKTFFIFETPTFFNKINYGSIFEDCSYFSAPCQQEFLFRNKYFKKINFSEYTFVSNSICLNNTLSPFKIYYYFFNIQILFFIPLLLLIINKIPFFNKTKKKNLFW